MPTPEDTRPAASAAGFPDVTDLQLLNEAQGQLEQERAARAAVDAVDELEEAAHAFTMTYLRGGDIAPAMAEVARAMFDVMGAAVQAGLLDGAR